VSSARCAGLCSGVGLCVQAIAEPAQSGSPPQAGILSTSKIVLGMMHATSFLAKRDFRKKIKADLFVRRNRAIGFRQHAHVLHPAVAFHPLIHPGGPVVTRVHPACGYLFRARFSRCERLLGERRGR